MDKMRLRLDNQQKIRLLCPHLHSTGGYAFRAEHRSPARGRAADSVFTLTLGAQTQSKSMVSQMLNFDMNYYQTCYYHRLVVAVYIHSDANFLKKQKIIS